MAILICFGHRNTYFVIDIVCKLCGSRTTKEALFDVNGAMLIEKHLIHAHNLK
jgi:hypothetical protein